jgi:hypothetical protein
MSLSLQEKDASRIHDIHYVDLVYGTEAVRLCAEHPSLGYMILSPDPSKRGLACSSCDFHCHIKPAKDYQFLLVYLSSLGKKDVRLGKDLKEACYSCSD